ncbi:RNA polymerase sigma factor [Mucilaginibacter terrae]|uniref:RNA polymerase sigma factor n=1 Tax=Mucilaginibacter terrae TaxID=1955052 RepID=UPI00362B9E79
MGAQSALNDTELQLLLVNGKEEAFTVLYDRYYRPLYLFVFKLIKSAALSEDITQEIFLKLWTNRLQLEKVQSFKAYLFISARNHAINCLTRGFKTESASSEILAAYFDQYNSTEDHLLSKEYLAFLNHQLSLLPDRTRQIFYMCREEGKSYEEAATAMGISRNAVKNHMVHSMKVLRMAVEKDLGISLTVLLAVLLKK